MGERRRRRRPPCRDFGGDARSQELAALIVRRSGQISALHHEQLADIAEFDRAQGWRGDGAVSMIGWVTGQCGVSTSTARQWVRSGIPVSSRCPASPPHWLQGSCRSTWWNPAEVATASTDAALRDASADWSVRQARRAGGVASGAEEQAAESAGAGPDQAGPDGGGRAEAESVRKARENGPGSSVPPPGSSSAARSASTTPGGRCGWRSPKTTTPSPSRRWWHACRRTDGRASAAVGVSGRDVRPGGVRAVRSAPLRRPTASVPGGQ